MSVTGSPTALIIGGTGQIGVATARLLATTGWSVLLAHRGDHAGNSSVADLDVTTIRLDRNDTDALLATARGHDLVLDAVAYDPLHAAQLRQLAGEVGSLVVISTGSVYTDHAGRYLDIATGPDDFPDFPEPLREDDATIENDAQTYSPLKAAMERSLLAEPGLPVSILRPGAILGPFSRAPREWYFVKRARDRRRAAPVAFDGLSRFSTSSSGNIAELVRVCAVDPGRRILNAVDDENPTVAEIGQAIFTILGADADIVPFAGPPRGDVGDTPWSVAHPIVLSMDAAHALGYRQPVSYRAALEATVDWLVRTVADAELQKKTWADAFPALVARYGAAAWFDYAAENAFLAGLRAR